MAPARSSNARLVRSTTANASISATAVQTTDTAQSLSAVAGGRSTVHSETKWVGRTRVRGDWDALRVGPKKTSMIQMKSSSKVPLTGFGTVAPTIAPKAR